MTAISALKKLPQKIRHKYHYCLGLILSSPLAAHAEPWDDLATGVLGALTGGLARTIAVIFCIGLGIAALAGKLTWGWAGTFILGIVIIFGAPAIVDFFAAFGG